MSFCQCMDSDDEKEICEYCREVMQRDFEWWVYRRADEEEAAKAEAL